MTSIEVIAPHEVSLGSDEGLPVRRTLPTRARSLIGAWCFLDHYGPQPVYEGVGMSVRAHPHTGLQTVSWLFAGEIEHRDSAGTVAMVRPGELNLMTAGRGISHSEMSLAQTSTLHGVQLWVALPDVARWMDPGFEHYVPHVIERDGVRAWVFIGSLLGSSSPVTTYSPLLGAELVLNAGSSIDVPIDSSYEHGVLLDTGAVEVNDDELGLHHLAYLAPGSSALRLRAHEESRLIVLGGVPLGESIVMWWNFIGRSHEEIVQFRTQWNVENANGSLNPQDHPAFGWPCGEAHEPILAPELPPVRLVPRS